MTSPDTADATVGLPWMLPTDKNQAENQAENQTDNQAEADLSATHQVMPEALIADKPAGRRVRLGRHARRRASDDTTNSQFGAPGDREAFDDAVESPENKGTGVANGSEHDRSGREHSAFSPANTDPQLSHQLEDRSDPFVFDSVDPDNQALLEAFTPEESMARRRRKRAEPKVVSGSAPESSHLGGASKKVRQARKPSPAPSKHRYRKIEEPPEVVARREKVIRVLAYTALIAGFSILTLTLLFGAL